VLTGTYGAQVITPLVPPGVEVRAVPNGFFAGNIGVAGLLTGADLTAALADAPPDRRYLLPDVCLSGGRFLDGLLPGDLPRPVEVVPADGAALRAALTR
jgi:NifB/MoaA-like Fe-S oxidoreductase